MTYEEHSRGPLPTSAADLIRWREDGELHFYVFLLKDGRRFNDTNGNPTVRGVELPQSNFAKAKLAKSFLREANLEGAVFDAADLEMSDLYRARMRGSRLRFAKLHQAQLFGADLQNAVLTAADLRYAGLQHTRLTNANLSGADLRHAYLPGTDLTNADLSRADLRGAKLAGACIDGAQLRGVAFDYGESLLVPEWNSVKFGDDVYRRELVERGEQFLPIGQPDPLRFVFRSTRSLTTDELDAVRQLVASFGSVSQATRLVFQLVAAGEQLVVESHTNPEEAARIGLAILQRSAQPGQTFGQLSDIKQLATTILENQKWQAARDGVTARRLETVLEALTPHSITFQNESEAADFLAVTDKAGFRLEPLRTSAGKVLEFGKSFTNTPEAAGLCWSMLAVALGHPAAAGLLGVGATAVGAASKKKKPNDDGAG